MTGSRLISNSMPEHGQPLTETESQIAGKAGPARVRVMLGAFPDYAPTPLVDLPDSASRFRVGAVMLKDESGRYGLGSFKALGGAYAVARLLQAQLSDQLGRMVAPEELLTPEIRALAAKITVCCATDGNHGRSVARGASLFGCRCVIYLHAGVSTGREAAIAQFGAEMRRVPGNYDDSVAEARRVAEAEGWLLVSDFSSEGYEEIPGLVMQGYTIMMDEILAEAPAPFTHVFVQAGVGGLAGVVCGYFHDVLGPNRPRTIVVEPDLAPCLQASAAAGRLVSVPAGAPTVMAMLECYEPSLAAWRIVAKSADDFLLISDAEAVAGLRRLAGEKAGDRGLVIGESGASGYAALQVAADDPDLRARLGLDRTSRVLLIGTEGATDPEVYQALLGQA